MKRLALLILAAFALPLAAAPAAAQIAPGLRAPETIRGAVAQAWLMGCYFAATERPAAGLNIDTSMGGPGLHEPRSIPAGLRPFLDTLADHVRLAVLDAPGGEVWMFFDARAKRCTIVTNPADAEGMSEEFASLIRLDNDWRPVTRAGGGAAFEQDFEAATRLRRPGGRLRAWYQPAAGPASPQMIVVERVR
jgi:hypothetical protein